MFIVATISKNSYSADKIEEIIRAGASILRFNFSHGTPLEVQAKVMVARDVIKKLGLVGKVRIMADLPGAKVRMGSFAGGEHQVQIGQKLVIKSAAHSSNPAEFLPVQLDRLGTRVKVGQIVTLGDGETGFEVEEITDENSFRVVALSNSSFSEYKGINLGSVIDSLDHFTPAMLEHLQYLVNIKPELVAFSFVNSEENALKAKALLTEYISDVWQPQLVAKIETAGGVENIAAIADVFDILLVARGDLGLTCPIETLGLSQKKIVKAAKAAGKEVIVSTQVLDSMVNYYLPTRAEVLDLTNIVLDGADGIMLAKETGISLTPGRSVTMAKKIIEAVEKSER